MKEHLIKETTFGSKEDEEDDYDRYSIYKNPDPKLRKEIKSFVGNPEVVCMGWPDEKWTILEYEENEVKCKNGRNISYFPIDEIKEAQKHDSEYNRNQKYQPIDYFKKHFGIISHLSKHKKSITLKKLDLQGIHSLGELVGMENKPDPTSVEHYSNFYEYEVDYYSGDEIKIKASKSIQSLNLYFNENGDYVNRNYNENLNDFKCKDIHPKVVITHLKKLLTTEFGKKLEFSNGKYYTNKVCLVPYLYKEQTIYNIEFGIDIYIPIDKEAQKYKKWRSPMIRRPKKTVTVPSEHLYNTIMEMMPNVYKDLFNGIDTGSNDDQN